MSKRRRVKQKTGDTHELFTKKFDTAHKEFLPNTEGQEQPVLPFESVRTCKDIDGK